MLKSICTWLTFKYRKLFLKFWNFHCSTRTKFRQSFYIHIRIQSLKHISQITIFLLSGNQKLAKDCLRCRKVLCVLTRLWSFYYCYYCYYSKVNLLTMCQSSSHTSVVQSQSSANMNINILKAFHDTCHRSVMHEESEKKVTVVMRKGSIADVTFVYCFKNWQVLQYTESKKVISSRYKIWKAYTFVAQWVNGEACRLST